MSLRDELLEIEKGFWTAGADHYRQHLDAQCLTVFPGMAAAMSPEQIAATVEDGPRWEDPQLDVQGMVTPSDDVVLFTYEARASRQGEPYHALVSSGYVRRDDGWKMAFHQQAPVGEENGGEA